MLKSHCSLRNSNSEFCVCFRSRLLSCLQATEKLLQQKQQGRGFGPDDLQTLRYNTAKILQLAATQGNGKTFHAFIGFRPSKVAEVSVVELLIPQVLQLEIF